MTAISRPEQLALQVHDDENCNHSGNPSLNDIIDARMSRRGIFKAAFGTAGTAVLGSVSLAACGGGDDALVPTPAPVPTPTPDPRATKLGFTAVAKNKLDTVTVAAGDSLSKIACAITGTSWNGPRFFGLRQKRQGGAGSQDGGRAA